MKRIDRLILAELVGPWVFGVAIFTVLIMAGTWLFKLTDYMVSGISFFTVMYFTVLLIPGIMVKTFSMAVLLASLLAFGRLSSDSEIVALKAAGASIGRIMMPVAAFSLAVAILSFTVNETLVPYGSFKAVVIKSQIEKQLKGAGQPVFYPIKKDGKLVASIMAGDFNLGERSLRNVILATFDKNEEPMWILRAQGMKYENEKEWRVSGGGRMFSYDGETVFDVGDIWPGKQLGDVQPPKPEDIVAQTLRDLDSFSLREMAERISVLRKTPGIDPGQIANLEYGYYNKMALPLSCLIFALVGAPLGIRSHRTGAASGFWISIIIIFSYMMLANLMAIVAQGGKIPSFMASFTPLIIGAIFAVILIRKKNT